MYGILHPVKVWIQKWMICGPHKSLKVLPVSFIDSNQPNLDDLCNTNSNDSVWSMYCRPMSPPSIPSIPCRSLKLDSLVDPTLLIMIMPVTSIYDNPFLFVSFIWFSQSHSLCFKRVEIYRPWQIVLFGNNHRCSWASRILLAYTFSWSGGHNVANLQSLST